MQQGCYHVKNFISTLHYCYTVRLLNCYIKSYLCTHEKVGLLISRFSGGRKVRTP